MSFGVTAQGFNRKLLSDISAETEADFKQEYGNDIDLDPREPLGQFKGIYDERINKLWELSEAVYNFLNVEQAEEVSLDNLVILNGVARLPATHSKLAVRVVGAPGTVVPVGYQVQKIGDASIVFQNPLEAAIPGGGSIDLIFEALLTGPIFVSYDTVEPVVPVAGITSAYNVDDAVVGRNVETDAELKTRRLISIQNQNSPSDQGIRAALLDRVENISSAIVISNRTNTTVDGRPPKSFEAIVENGIAEDIAQVIFDNLPAGIQPYGDENVIITGEDNNQVNIGFTFVSKLAFLAEITVGKNTDPDVGDLYPDDGDERIKNALVGYFATFSPNQDLINSQTYRPINTVPGIISIVAEYKKPGGSFTENNITITAKELITLAYSDITIITA